MTTELESELAAIIGRYASELSGREFQRAVMTVAQGYFEPSDLYQDLAEALCDALNG